MVALGNQNKGTRNIRSREDVILQNGLLFNVIRKNKAVEKKLLKVQKYLDAGADINATDANDKNNTPLHIAVIKGERLIIQLLLERGAHRNMKNTDNLTPMEMAAQLNIPDKENISNILQKYTSIAASEQTVSAYKKKSSVQSCQNIGEGHEYNENNMQLMYRKRSGTSGLGGQLYETKLLSLILLRALNDDDINTFYLGTNVEGVGAFDDIILRYNLNDTVTPKILFIQAKHKDVSGKDKLTTKEVLNDSGNFSLHKYLDSYITIRQKFMANHDDAMFSGIFKDVECEFIIYTPVEENFTKKKIVVDTFPINKVRNLVSANSKGKVLQFDYDETDVDSLVQTMAISRTKSLAKAFMKFILKDTWHNMLSDGLLKTFHVYIAQNVIQVAVSENSDNSYLKAKFRNTFFDSDNFIIKSFKNIVFNEAIKNLGTESSLHIEDLIKSLSFKVHSSFGNLKFDVGGNDHKKRKIINYIMSTLKKLLLTADESSIITINEESVGPGKLLQYKDLEIYRLGGLVGNLLILDGETEMLKFNNDENLLPEDVKILIEQLKKIFPCGISIEKYRFDINVHGFPKLLINVKKHDSKLVREFLNSLKFYTNQAREDEVENILKNEIDTFYNAKEKKNSFLYRVKGDAIFLKVHHNIQKWWKQQNVAPYLTVDCNFFDQAKQDIFGSSLLSVFHFLFAKNIMNINFVQFNEHAIKPLEISKFLVNNVRSLLNIVTNNVILSSIKLNQYFQQKSACDYVFIDLDFIVDKNCFEVIWNELNEAKIKLLIILLRKHDLIEEVENLLKIPIDKVIVVTKWSLKEHINQNLFDLQAEQIDVLNKLHDLTVETQKYVMERNIAFQGVDIPLKQVLEVGAMNFIEPEVLWNVINGIKIKIGVPLTNSVYEEVKECYVDRSVSRYIKLKPLKPKTAKYIIMNMINDSVKNETPDHDQDIILISDKIEYFLELCDKFRSRNIHWFVKENGDCVWKKSHGELAKLFEYVERGLHSSYTFKLSTLNDIDDNLVVVSADPGMGKSTLLTHIAIQTKFMYPSMWVMKINLLDHKNTFNRWKENKIGIDLKIVIKFMLLASKIQICNDPVNEVDSESEFRNLDITMTDDGKICLQIKSKSNIDELVITEVNLFVYLFNQKKIALLLDGFDEICPDYTAEVIKLVGILKDCHIKHLWIATRSYNILKQLEEKLCVFSFNLDPLSQTDQKIFLEMFWSNRLQERRCGRLTFYLNRFFDTICEAINDKDTTFMSVPLHAYMIAEIFQDFFKDFYDIIDPKIFEQYMVDIQETGNLIALYEQFTNIKFRKIRFGEKKPSISANDPDIKKIIENERRYFIRVHKYLAAYLLLDKNINGLFLEHEIIEINELIRKVSLGEEKTGIINQIVANEPKFIHYTFAEYFANEYLCDKLKSDACTTDVWIYLFNTILNSNDGIRMFFECKLGQDQVLANLSSNVDHKDKVFDTLLTQRFIYNTTLYVAIEQHSEATAMFVLKSMKTVLTANNLDDFISYLVKRCIRCCSCCAAVENGLKNVLNFIIETVRDIDSDRIIDIFQCCDLPYINPICLAANYCELDEIIHERNKEIIDIFFKYINNADTLVELFMLPCCLGSVDCTVLHILSRNCTRITVVLKYLLKLNNKQRIKVLSKSDRNNKLAAHYAAMNGDFNYFEELEKIVDKHQFTKICLACDLKGFTPISYLKVSLGRSEFVRLLFNRITEHAKLCKTCHIPR